MVRFEPVILPAGLHRIRHYGLLANTARKDHLARARERLMHDKTNEPLTAEANAGDTADSGHHDASTAYLCPHCGAAMVILETFARAQFPRAAPPGGGVS